MSVFSKGDAGNYSSRDNLRPGAVIRRPKKASLKGQGLGQITGAVSIRERPASVEDRAVPGHWEGDLICGSNNSFIAILVERHTRYVILAKVSGKDTEAVINALIKQAKKLPNELYKLLTNTSLHLQSKSYEMNC